MLLTGEPISAATALEWGLVKRAVPAARLDSAVDELVAAISRSSPLIVGIGKEAFDEQVELDEHRAYDLTKSVMAMNSMAADAQEGICAFLEKRTPNWNFRLSLSGAGLSPNEFSQIARLKPRHPSARRAGRMRQAGRAPGCRPPGRSTGSR